LDTDDPFELEKLKLTPEEVQTYARAARGPNRRRQRFIKFPWSWADSLKSAHYTSSYRVAIHLLYQHWKANGSTIRLSNVACVGWRGCVTLGEMAGISGTRALGLDQG